MIEDATGIDNYLERNKVMERTEAKLIGLSMSGCIRDLVLRKVRVKDVEKIIARTAVWNEKQLELLLLEYASEWEMYFYHLWQTEKYSGPYASEEIMEKRVEVAKSLTRRLYRDGLIEQPRLTKRSLPVVHSVYPRRIWVADESQIEWKSDERGIPHDWEPEESLAEIAQMTRQEAYELERKYESLASEAEVGNV